MIKYLQVIFFVCLLFQLKAQNYDRALGCRAGVTPGIEYKKFIDYEKAIEALISFKRGGIQFTYMKLYHQPVFLFSEGKILVYFGYGPHVGYARLSNEKYFFNGNKYRKRETEFSMGFDGNVGLEYQFPHNPLVICIDYKPYFEICYPLNFITNNYDFALALKFSF